MLETLLKIRFFDTYKKSYKNGHETDLKMSPEPLGTTVFMKFTYEPWANSRIAQK